MQLDPKSHRYHLNDDEYTSVTTLVHKCFKPFDADKILQTMKIKGTKYEGMSKEEIYETFLNGMGFKLNNLPESINKILIKGGAYSK